MHHHTTEISFIGGQVGHLFKQINMSNKVDVNRFVDQINSELMARIIRAPSAATMAMLLFVPGSFWEGEQLSIS